MCPRDALQDDLNLLILHTLHYMPANNHPSLWIPLPCAGCEWVCVLHTCISTTVKRNRKSTPKLQKNDLVSGGHGCTAKLGACVNWGKAPHQCKYANVVWTAHCRDGVMSCCWLWLLCAYPSLLSRLINHHPCRLPDSTMVNDYVRHSIFVFYILNFDTT